MIAEAELRRLAAKAGVDLMIQDLDYGLSWFLSGLFAHTYLSSELVFKGGTCLRKCYIPDYRFSEDLDFTVLQPVRMDDVKTAVAEVTAWCKQAQGPDFLAASPRFERISDSLGNESYQARVSYRGPLRWGGSPRSIQLDLSLRALVPLNGISPKPVL